MSSIRHNYSTLPLASLLLPGALLAILLVAACSAFMPTVKGTVDNTIEVNEAVGEAEAKMMVLNILRAMRKQPLVFTDYAQFSQGLPNSNFKISLAAPLNKSTADLGGNSSTESFTSTPLDQNQVFIRNIMTPIPPETVMYYHDKGWPTSLLLHLFVSEVVVHPDGKTSHDVSTIYSNYPYILATYRKFGALANDLAGCQVSITDPPELPVVKPSSDAKSPPPPPRKLVFSPLTGGASTAKAACDAALKSLTINGATYDLIYRSPLDAVRYLGDVVREQQFGDDYDTTSGKAENIGIVAYSDGCFYQQDSAGTVPCEAYCNALFVLQTDPPQGAANKAPVCATDQDMAWGKTYTKPESENLASWSVKYQGPTYYLPLHYMDHSETLHTLFVLELLIGYQAGTQAGGDSGKDK